MLYIEKEFENIFLLQIENMKIVRLIRNMSLHIHTAGEGFLKKEYNKNKLLAKNETNETSTQSGSFV